MKIQSLKIKNFKLIKEEELNLQGRHVWLLGPNASGKSSILQAACGEMPEEPLKEGETKGNVEIVITDKETDIAYTCLFKFSKTNQKATLSITDATGATQKAPATLFNSLFNVSDFNIDEFLKLSDSKQLDKIKELAGIDWTDVEARHKELFDERTFKTRKVKEVDNKLLGTTYDKRMSTDVIDPEEINGRLNKAISHNEKVQSVYDGTKQRAEKLVEMKAKADELLAQIQQLSDQADIIRQEMIKGDKWLEANPKIDLTSIQQEQSDLTAQNATITANNAVKALKDESEGLWLEINDIEKELDTIKTTKENQFREAQDNGLIPVKGLTIDYEDSSLRLDGFPFNSKQVNTARKIMAGLEIQEALMCKDQVRIARFDGSLLDNNSIQEVFDWAKEKDMQLFIECVDRNSESLTIEIVEE